MKQEFTTINKKLDGSTSECTATLENGEMTFEESSTPSTTSSLLYSHHFALIFVNDPIFGTFGVDVNAISNNPQPYEKLSDLEGDGYIMSAFGSIGETAFVDLRLIHNGTCFMYITQMSDGTMSGYYIENMGDYEVNDSVSKI